MSSTITTELIHQLPKMSEDKPHLKLVRTSSIDKIRRFNSYLCSQHFFILPALLAWLKSSQFALHSAAEKIIHLISSTLLDNLIYKLVLLDATKITESVSGNVQNVKARISNFYEVFSNDFESTFLQYTVYSIGVILSLQLSLCTYLFCSMGIPLGFVFLLVCWCYINILQMQTLQTGFAYIRENFCDKSSTGDGSSSSRASRSKKRD